jgi:hypothetical protein
MKLLPVNWKITLTVALMILGLSIPSFAALTVSMEADNFISGVDNTATVRIYLQMGADGYDLQSFNARVIFPAGVSATVNEIVLTDAVVAGTPIDTADALGFSVGVTGPPTSFSIPYTAERLLFATIRLSLPADQTTSVSLAVPILNGRGWNGSSSVAYATNATADDKKLTYPSSLDVPVFVQRAVADGSLFIQQGAETSKVYTLSSTGGDADAAVTYALVGDNGGATRGTVTLAGNQATYTVNDIDTEFYDDEADSFQFTAYDATTGTSAPATVTVSYRANPPAVITALDGQPPLGSSIPVDEVDAAGTPTSFTLGINAADDPIVAPNGVARIEWAVTLADGESNAWIVDEPVSEYDPAAASQDSSVTITLPGYDTITGSPRPQSKDFLVTVTVTDVLGASSTANWTVQVNDVDRPQEAPQGSLAFAPAAPRTADDISVSYPTVADDLDGDDISYRVTWTSGAKSYVGTTLPSSETLKGETWTASVVSVTAPYGTDVLSTPLSTDVTIGNTAPVVADGNLFIRMTDGLSAVGTFTLTASDADPADAFTYSMVSANGGATKGTLEIDGNVATYTVTDPSVEFYGDDADTFLFLANDGMDDSNVATVTVTYRANPPAEIAALPGLPALEDVVEVPEVDAAGNPSIFTLGINATDDPIVSPYGVKKIAWAVNGNPADWLISAPVSDYAELPASQDNSVDITLPGYDTITGDGRPAAQDFVVTVTVWDAMDVESSANWTIRVSDVDRPASAPGILELLVDGVAVADGGEARVAQLITQNADGSIDPDGDVVTDYEFSWSNDRNDSTDITTRAKGETWTLTARAKTTVYGAEVISTEFSSTSVNIVNTPPVLTLALPLPWAGANALLEDCGMVEQSLLDFVVAADDDAADNEAGRSYSVSFTEDEKGSLSYDPTEKMLAFTPSEDFYGTVSFTVTANDGTDESEPLTVTFDVLPVNDAPVVFVHDFYALPDDCSGLPAELEFAAVMGGGADSESEQSLIAATIVDFVDADGILAGPPIISVDVHTVTVSYTLLEDAKDKLGSEAIITFTVQDDGGSDNGGVDTSAPTSFKIVLGATPWYPLYELTAAKLAEMDGFDAYSSYVIRVLDLELPAGGIFDATLLGNNPVVLAQNTLRAGETFTPAKYFSSDVACAGLLPSGTVGLTRSYVVQILPRDKNGIVANMMLFDTVEVPYYEAPTTASLGVVVAANDVIFAIEAPMASTYSLRVYSILLGGTPELVFERADVAFQPGDDDMIIPVTELEAKFLRAGAYYAELSSANPVGASDGVLADANFAIDDDGDEPSLEWPEDGFSPELALTVSNSTANPRFTWPEIGAVSYRLWVADATGKTVVAGVAVNGSSYNAATLNAGETYSWWVVAIAADATQERSPTLSFAILQKSDTPIVTTVTVAGASSLTFAVDAETLPEATTTYYYDIEYVAYNAGNPNFHYFKYALKNAPRFDLNDATTAVTVNLGISVAAGDYIFVRAMDAQGNALSDYLLYKVQ